MRVLVAQTRANKKPAEAVPANTATTAAISSHLKRCKSRSVRAEIRVMMRVQSGVGRTWTGGGCMNALRAPASFQPSRKVCRHHQPEGGSRKTLQLAWEECHLQAKF